jgi:hypothetical protein
MFRNRIGRVCVLVQEKDDIFVLTSCQQQLMEFHPRSCNRDILTHMRSSRAAFLPRYIFLPVFRIRIRSGNAFILVGWIRIRIGNSDPDPGGPKWTIKVKKIKVLKC